jgi:glycerol-3-phosphate acyltransferase PlsY
MIYVILIIIAYLLGSIPFGYMLAKISGKGDIRNVGSGGTGATNVMRVGGFKMRAATWALDMGKSIVAVLFGANFGGAEFGALCGLVAVIGHCWPIWLKFKGGKGISPMFGMMLAVNPFIFVICAVEWLIVSLTTGYSSLASIIAFLVFPILGFAISMYMGWIFIGVSILCLWRHRENIQRLMMGTESKIKWKK